MLQFENLRNWVIYSFIFMAAFPASAAIVPAPPAVNAKSYLVQDFRSGRIIVSENIDERVEPASLTKLMTVYIAARELAAGHIHMDDKVLVSEKAWRMGGSRMFIEVNKKVSVGDLLKGIIVSSGNDASVALAEYISGSEEVFVSEMNLQAKQLGMKNTHFVNSTGWPDENHYSTARDLAILARAVVHEHPDIYALYSLKEFTYNGIKQHNRNQLLWRDDSVDGLKTGHTDSAGFCLIASAKRDNMRLISVVMGTSGFDARTQATQSLLNYAFRFYETRKLYKAHESIASNKIWKGDVDNINLGINDDLWITFPRNKFRELDKTIDVPPQIIAPVNKGDRQGVLKVTLDGEELAERPLVALESVGEGGFFERIRDDIKLMLQ